MADPGIRAPGRGPVRRTPAPLPARLLGAGARGARRVARAAGLDETVGRTSEEAIVRALESTALERAIGRVLAERATPEAIDRALASPELERALGQALDSELVDRLWERLLASDEAQKLVERIAEAPEVRAALAAQGVGLIEDLGRQVRQIAGHVDDVLERVARALFRRPRRGEPTDRVGLLTRALAAAIDAAIINGALLGISALVGLVVTGISDGGDGVSGPALALGVTGWILAGSAYLVTFWSLAGQTPGMRFLAIRLDAAGEARIGARRARRRLLGTALAVLPLGLGLLGILLSERRRGFQDRLAGTEVVNA